MSAEDALLVIDANKYLDLYRTVSGKKLVASLVEQAAHIFITRQIVEEVQRNKIEVVKTFLSKQFGELKLQTFAIPDHLFGTDAAQSKSIKEQMSEIVQKIKQLNKDVDKLAVAIMEQVYQSQDEVSRALAPIFARAVVHSPAELERAKDRRNRGNPPGKGSNPIGDQLTWEQVLTVFAGKKRLWIISRDGDYGEMHEGKGYLNLLLYDELRKNNPDAQAFLFADIVDGIKDFAAKTGVTADKLPSPEEAKEIKEEEEQLPPLDWLDGNSMDLANAIARRNWQQWHRGGIVQPMVVEDEVPLGWLQPTQPIISRPPPAPQPPPPRPVVVQSEPPRELFEVRQPMVSRPPPPPPPPQEQLPTKTDKEPAPNEPA